MKKFTVILSVVAIAASALMMSCAKKHEPVPVPAFPRERTVTYEFNTTQKDHLWTYASTDGWTSGNKWSGFRYCPTGGTTTTDQRKDSRILLYMAPNQDWTARIVGSAKNFMHFLVGGEFWTGSKAYEISGLRDNQVELVIEVDKDKIPGPGEEELVGKIELDMAGQVMPLATIIIKPSGRVATFKYDRDAAMHTWEISDFHASVEGTKPLGIRPADGDVNSYQLILAMAPHKNWVARIVDTAQTKKYLKFEDSDDNYEVRGEASDYTELTINVEKVPSGEDSDTKAYTCQLELYMDGVKSSLAVITIDPTVL